MQAPCHICREKNFSEFRAVDINGQKGEPKKLTKIVRIELDSSKLGNQSLPIQDGGVIVLNLNGSLYISHGPACLACARPAFA
jgi:hypothetical protein